MLVKLKNYIVCRELKRADPEINSINLVTSNFADNKTLALIVNKGLSDHESLKPVPVQLTGTCWEQETYPACLIVWR